MPLYIGPDGEHRPIDDGGFVKAVLMERADDRRISMAGVCIGAGEHQVILTLEELHGMVQAIEKASNKALQMQKDAAQSQQRSDN